VVIAVISGAVGVAGSACAKGPVASARPPTEAEAGAGVAREGLVGMRRVEIAATGRPSFHAYVWYPTSGGTAQTIRATPALPGYQAVPDGVVAVKSPAPLVIVLHGSGGGGQGVAWIALDLVAQGAIAVAADHPASTYGGDERRILDIWEQPDDVRAMIDQLTSSEWSRYIDPGRIAVAGFSLGGLSAMLLAGARLELQKAQGFCKTHHDGACEGLVPHFASFDGPYFEHANADHADHRIRAAVAIAPGFTDAMTPASLHDLAPTLLIAAEHDQQLSTEARVRPMLQHLRAPSEYREIAAAQHYSFLPVCSPNAVELLAPTHEEFLCEERFGRTREQIHAEALDAIATFLRARGILASRR
jgi:predicted dienelactone hydrolase